MPDTFITTEQKDVLAALEVLNGYVKRNSTCLSLFIEKDTIPYAPDEEKPIEILHADTEIKDMCDPTVDGIEQDREIVNPVKFGSTGHIDHISETLVALALQICEVEGIEWPDIV